METTLTTPSQLVIYVQPRTVYGEQKIYPACAKAEQFAAIAGTATLTERTIKAIKALGYEIKVDDADRRKLMSVIESMIARD